MMTDQLSAADIEGLTRISAQHLGPYQSDLLRLLAAYETLRDEAVIAQEALEDMTALNAASVARATTAEAALASAEAKLVNVHANCRRYEEEAKENAEWLDRCVEWQVKAEAAEARVRELEAADKLWTADCDRAEQAEAKVDVLRDALSHIVNTWSSKGTLVWDYVQAALSTLDSSADRLTGELAALRELASSMERLWERGQKLPSESAEYDEAFDVTEKALAAWRKIKEGT
jgi:uncharacterized membrane protein YheB (UPF0754 family)